MSQPCKQLDHHNSLHLSSGADGRVAELVKFIMELKLSAFYSLTFFRMAAIIIFKRFLKVTALKANFSLTFNETVQYSFGVHRKNAYQQIFYNLGVLVKKIRANYWARNIVDRF